MKFRALPLGFLILSCALQASAETLIVKNGDRITGEITHADEKQITIKTDYAGAINVQWPAVAQVTSEKTLYIVTRHKVALSGSVTTQEEKLIVATPDGNEVPIPISEVSSIRSVEEEMAWEIGLRKGLLENWKGNISAGFATAGGNSQTTNLSVSGALDRKTKTDHFAIAVSSVYATNNAPAPTGGTTANTILGGIHYDRDATLHLFGFGSGDFVFDDLQKLDLRSIYSLGMGVHIINRRNLALDLRGGANYTREVYGTGVERNLAAGTVGQDFSLKWGKGTTLTEHYYFYPDFTETGEYRFSFDAAATTKVTKWLSWQVTVSDRYVSNPPVIGTRANDYIFSTGLGFTFEH